MKNVLFVLFISLLFLSAKAQEYDGEVLRYVSYVEASKEKLIYKDTIVYQINNRQGEYLTQLNLLYNKGDKITIGDSWIEDKNGQVVRRLKKSDIEDVSAVSYISLYDERRMKRFSLKHNDYPYKVVVSYIMYVPDFLHIASWRPDRRVPTRSMTMVVTTPEDYEIRYKQENISEPIVSTAKKMKKVEWNTSYMPKKREVNAPTSAVDMPSIEVVPVQFKYGVEGSFESWQTFGNWIAQLNANASDLPDSDKKMVDGLLQGVDDVREKIKKLYYYLQDNTRYINVTIEEGGLRSYPASYVSANKYGDCKALCNYMKCLLEHDGIKSYYTLIKSGVDIKDVDKSFPMQSFDHIILTIPLENDTLFLECTNRNIPAGYLGTFTQGREALMIDGLNSRFVTTPMLTPEDVFSTRVITTTLNTGEVPVAMNMRLRGDHYEEYTYLSSDVSRSDAEKYIRQRFLSGKMNLTHVEFKKRSRDLPEIDVVIDVKAQGTYKKMGNNVMISTFPHDFPAFESPDKRTQSLLFDFPFHYKDIIRYEMTSDLTFEQLPENIFLETKYGKYKIEYRIEDNCFVLEKDILIHEGHYPLDEYVAFYTFISEIKSNEKKNIYINKP